VIPSISVGYPTRDRILLPACLGAREQVLGAVRAQRAAMHHPALLTYQPRTTRRRTSSLSAANSTPNSTSAPGSLDSWSRGGAAHACRATLHAHAEHPRLRGSELPPSKCLGRCRGVRPRDSRARPDPPRARLPRRCGAAHCRRAGRHPPRIPSRSHPVGPTANEGKVRDSLWLPIYAPSGWAAKSTTMS
jgi:hypothetical protein